MSPTPSDDPLQGPLVAVVGPTASGKTALAITLAEALDGEIVNTDSLQVYRLLDIGTAKPTAEERTRVPHHLIDVVNPDEPFSAGHYVAAAREAIAGIRARGRVPILCGGTGLYFRALLEGLAAIPPIPPDVVAALEAWVAEVGLPAAHTELRRVDPDLADRIDPGDPQRIVRALAVHRATGRPLSHYQQAQPFASGAARPRVQVGYGWERAALYGRINQRVADMLAAGWLEEVRTVLASGYAPDCKPLQSIGYKELVQHLRGERPAEELEAAIAQRTRRYAKRQLTWFRGQANVQWLPPGDSAAALRAVRAVWGTQGRR